MTRDYMILAPLFNVAAFAMGTLYFFKRRRYSVAVFVGVSLLLHACLGFEMHYGGRSWHDLLLGPCSRTEYHTHPSVRPTTKEHSR